MNDAQLAKPDTEAGSRPAPRPALTARALAIGLVLVVGFTVAGCFSVFLRYEILGTGYLPRGAVALLLALIGANVVQRWTRRLRVRLLSAGELLVIFTLLLVMGAIPGQEYAQHFYLNIIGIVYYAIPEIAPPEVYLDHLNPLLVPATDPAAPVIRWAHEGLPPGAVFPWQMWVVPLAVWTPFFLALYWMVLCFGALLAHRWEAEEKLLYPLVQVPLEVAEAEPRATSPVLRHPLMWLAFSVVMAHYTLGTIHGYWPSVPYIELDQRSRMVFSGPWSAFNGVLLFVRFDMIGIAYLLTAEVGFSLWFFFILRRLQQAFRIAIGINRDHYQFFEMQCIGGYALLAGALLWSARQHLARAVRVALGTMRLDANAPDADEPYRVAVFGFAAALVFVIAWCAYFGLGAVWAVLQYLLFPLMGMVVARVICEAGIFIYSSPFRVNEAIFKLAGTQRIGPMNLTLMTMTSWCQIRSTATQNMAAVAQGLRLGSHIGACRLHIMLVAMAAITVAILTCHVTAPYVIYKWGVPKLAPWPTTSSLHATNALIRFINTPFGPQTADWVALALGAGTTLALVVLRRQFLWWPLHPLGFITWLGWPIDRYWLSIFLGWLFKTTALRFAGFKGFSALRPIAFGLILGMNVAFTISLVLHFIWPAPALMID